MMSFHVLEVEMYTLCPQGYTKPAKAMRCRAAATFLLQKSSAVNSSYMQVSLRCQAGSSQSGFKSEQVCLLLASIPS